jgi:hypothetical protein
MKPEPMRYSIQRRDAENAEISAENTNTNTRTRATENVDVVVAVPGLLYASSAFSASLR